MCYGGLNVDTKDLLTQLNQYEDRIVAFIDVLGFKEMVRRSFDPSTSKTDVENFNHIKQILGIIHKTFDFDEVLKDRWDVSLFSDSVIITFPIFKNSEVFNILILLLHLNMELIGEKIVCRGAIVRGFCYHKNSIVFGPAVVQAIENEKKAEFPRIIVDKDVLKTGVEYPAPQNSSEDEYQSLKHIVRKDTDGEYFINYFDVALYELDDYQYGFIEYINWLKLVIIDNISNNHDQKVLKKYYWMRDKYNDLFKPILTRENIERLKRDIPELYDEVGTLSFIDVSN